MNYLNVNHAQTVLFFSKWAGKNYSSFQSLGRMVVISVLSVIYFVSTPVVSMATVQDTTEVKMEYDLDEIEVSAHRAPAMYSQVARIVSVIERKEIEASPAQSVQDLLEYVAGVDVRQRGAEGVQADVSVRGGTFDQTLILLNGINITDPQTGHLNLNLPVNLSQVQRIEILEGPAARVYGPNAFSGAINIVTRQPEGKTLELAATGGSFGFFEGNVATSFQTGKLNHLVSVNGKRSDGYIGNTDFETLNGFYAGDLKTQKGTLKYQLGATTKGFGANSFYTPKFPDQYEAGKTLLTSVRWESNGKFHFAPTAYYRRNQDRFELFRNEAPSWYTKHNHHITNVYGVNLNSWVNSSLGKTAFGAEWRSEHIISNVLGEDLDEAKKVPGENAEFTKSDERNIMSIYLEHSAYINKWTFTAGVMSNYITQSDVGLNFFPGFDISYLLIDEVKLYGSYNTSLRIPTFTDLYYKGPTNIGNPDLEPEKSATFEGGLKLSGKLVRGHAVVFYRKGKNLIDWVKRENEEVWQPQNLTDVNNLGTEIQTSFLFRNVYGKRYPNIQLSYLYNNLEKQESNIVSNYVLDNLKHKLVGSVNQQFAKHFMLDLKCIFQDRDGTYTRYINKVTAGETDYEPFWLVNAKLSYTNKGITIYGSANNIVDKQYNDLGNVIQPGRWLKAGVVYKLAFN